MALQAQTAVERLPQVVEGRYRLVRLIGKGASGLVFEAMSLGDAVASHGKRRVALKVLSVEETSDESSVARFTHEAFLGSRIDHKNLVPVLDFGFVSPGRPYCVMQLLKGATLDKILEDGPLPPALSIHLLDEAARGLSALHTFGIVHRDVKPANLFVSLTSKRPRLRVIDLGVAGVFDGKKAKKLGSVDVGARGTHGTPAYLAPEQALGLPSDARTDVYALACVAYKMLTGMDAFREKTVTATIQKHLFEDARPVSTLNPALSAEVDAVFTRALAKKREDRTRSVAQFVAELRAALA
jgi:eukaryotic-like serine/threonine-protein kinase